MYNVSSSSSIKASQYLKNVLLLCFIFLFSLRILLKGIFSMRCAPLFSYIYLFIRYLSILFFYINFIYFQPVKRFATGPSPSRSFVRTCVCMFDGKYYYMYTRAYLRMFVVCLYVSLYVCMY